MSSQINVGVETGKKHSKSPVLVNKYIQINCVLLQAKAIAISFRGLFIIMTPVG